MSKLIVSLSPHIHGNDSIERNMYGVIIALLPALLVSFYYFGIGAAIVCLTSVVACVFFEWVINRYLLNNRNLSVLDGSAVITGLLLAFNLPSNIPVWIVIIGSLVAIGIGKMTFGGLGCNPFNPALVGRCFLLVSFPVQMTSWPVAGQQLRYMDAVTGATPLSLMKEAVRTGDASILEKMPDSLSLLLGSNGIGLGGGTIGLSIIDRSGLYAMEENYHMAYTIEHNGNDTRFFRHFTYGRAFVCRSDDGTSLRWCDAGSHIYGHRLCNIAYDA